MKKHSSYRSVMYDFMYKWDNCILDEPPEGYHWEGDKDCGYWLEKDDQE